jgi:transcriptional regulator with XRE-family HTH domain
VTGCASLHGCEYRQAGQLGCPVGRWTVRACLRSSVAVLGRCRAAGVRAGTLGDIAGHSRTVLAVVDALYTGDLDLTAPATAAELAVLLRTVHLRADRPSLRALEARTRHDPAPLSKTVVSEMLKGVRFPRKAVMVSFLRACGEDEGRIQAWRRAWDQIAAGEHRRAARVPAQGAAGQPAGGSGEASALRDAELEQLREKVSRLSEDNARMRRRITAAGAGAVTPEAEPGGKAGISLARGPEVRRRELGARLRALRAERHMTIQQVAEHLFCSPGKVSRMENGFRAGTVRDVRDLCDLYGVSDASLRERLMELAHQSKQHGWWQDYDAPYSAYIGLEADATVIKTYQSTVVPGLLQTVGYARAILERRRAGSDSPELIEQRVQVRMMRQRVLTEDNPPKFWAILDEAALHRIVGSVAVMLAQLDRLAELSGSGNVTVEVIPYEAGAHPGYTLFNIFEFAGTLPAVVYMEGLFGEIYYEREKDVGRYEDIFTALHAIALDRHRSGELIMKIRSSLENIT